MKCMRKLQPKCATIECQGYPNDKRLEPGSPDSFFNSGARKNNHTPTRNNRKLDIPQLITMELAHDRLMSPVEVATYKLFNPIARRTDQNTSAVPTIMAAQ